MSWILWVPPFHLSIASKLSQAHYTFQLYIEIRSKRFCHLTVEDHFHFGFIFHDDNAKLSTNLMLVWRTSPANCITKKLIASSRWRFKMTRKKCPDATPSRRYWKLIKWYAWEQHRWDWIDILIKALYRLCRLVWLD